ADEPGCARLPAHAHLPGADPGAAVAEADRGCPRPGCGPASPGRGSLRPGGDQGPHPGTPGGPEAQSEVAGAHPVLPRPTGRRQDVAGPVDCPGDGAKV